MFAGFYLLLIFGLPLVWILKYWFDNRRFYELYAKIPQIKEGHLPIIGHLLGFLDANSQLLYDNIKKVTGPGPSPRKFSSGPFCFVVVDDPNQLQKILNSRHCTDKIPFYNAFVVKNGLITSNGTVWRSHRRSLEPAFNSTILKSFLPIFNEKSKIFVQVMGEKVHEKEFNINASWAALSLDNILSTSVGINKNIQTEKNNAYLESCMIALQIFGKKVSTFWLQIGPIFRMTKYYELEQKHVLNGAMKIADDVILRKEQALSEGIDKTAIESSKPQIFVDQLFKLREIFSMQDIKDEINTLIIAGFETVSTTMSLLSLLVAMHPEVQDKLFDELQTVFENADEEVTEEKIKELKYMDLVIKETMRFYPPVPLIARCPSEEIEIGGYTLPIGTNLIIPAFHVHRDKTYWGEDADEFKPERFEADKIAKVHSYSYLPFSRGPRNCIGYNYAQMSLKVVAAHFFRNFKLSTSLKYEDLTYEFVIVMKVSQGYIVSLERRNFK